MPAVRKRGRGKLLIGNWNRTPKKGGQIWGGNHELSVSEARTGGRAEIPIQGETGGQRRNIVTKGWKELAK